jgi:hypothetical protein
MQYEKQGLDYCFDGIQYCLENKVPFITDSFNNTPLDYAKETLNSKLIDRVYYTINQFD